MPTKVQIRDVRADEVALRAAITEQLKEQGLIPDLTTAQVKADERMRRRVAREYLQRQLGRPVSDNTMIYTWRIPYFRDGRDAIYLRSTLDRFVAERIARVSQQISGTAA